MPDESVGKRIRELRELQNKTREELAEEADISSKFLYEIEIGKKNFSSDVLYRLSKSLSVSCDYIMCGEEAIESREDMIVTIIEQLNTKQICGIQKLLKVIYEICDMF